MNRLNDNEAWARGIIARTDPDCRPRWEVYDRRIKDLSDPLHHCLNIGAGTDEPFDLSGSFAISVDTDILKPKNNLNRSVPFLQADLFHLPFASGSFDLVLLRFVAEHISDPPRAISEIERVLKPGGQVLILTTNLSSPFIFVPRFLLPYSLRRSLMKHLFQVDDEDIFPTYHRMNTHKSLSNLPGTLKVKQLVYLQDINWTRKWLFVLLYTFHLKTKFLHLTFLRSNILVTLKKVNS